ncbi:MAG: 6-bladed beta-propeller [Balneolaceae bacterium]|nr:6-bladed beta-propeller [Balneolaceae bacterium]
MLYSKGLPTIILLLLIFVSCSNDSQKTTEIHTSELPLIELDHQFTITEPDDIYFLQISGVKSDSQGRIYLPDQQALSVHLFDQDGSYIKSIGREGSGPGEFQSLVRIFIDQQDRLVTFDVRQARNTIFVETNDGWEPEQIFMIEGQRYGIESMDIDDNVILRQSPPQSPEPGAFWYEHELSAGNLETGLNQENVLRFKEMGHLVLDSGVMRGIPFGRTTILSTIQNGNIYLVWNEQFELAIYDAKMTLVDSLSVPIPNQPVSNEERNDALDRLGSEFRSLGREHIQGTKPVVNAMFIDINENIWLQTNDSPEYLILDNEGSPAGSFDLEEDLRLVHVDENRLYALKIGDGGYEVHVFGFRL